MNFSDVYKTMDFAATAARIAEHDAGDPEAVARARAALDRSEHGLDPEDLVALLSPAAAGFLEEMATRAQNLTRRRFGNVMQLYAPLYLSNECRSTCTYCGFSYGNDIRRRTLSLDEVKREGELLYEQGMRQVLLLTGEDWHRTPVDYIGSAAETLSPMFPQIGIEVYPLQEEHYTDLRGRGVDGLTVYQETYDPVRYREVHLRGQKKKLEYRLDCPDRGGRAGLRRIAIGALLGLSDPAAEVYTVALHARYLMKHYWSTQVAISLPRLREAVGFEEVPVLSDAVYLRYLTALRLFLPDAGILLSTRETPRFRDAVAPICITQMSAGSRTEPGGYSSQEATEQFQIEDTRGVEEIRRMLEERDLEPVFLDWATVMK